MSHELAQLTQWSSAAERVLRTAYGALLLLQLGMTARQSKRFFVSEKHGGYVESSPLRDRLLTPWSAQVVTVVWMLAALGIVADVALLPATIVNLALCRYFFVEMRWKGILRGMGAPGYMTYWMACLVALFALAHAIDRTGLLRAITLLTFRVDYALIMFMAGVYKLTAGYARGEGFERGLVNPWWGFWARRMRRLPPQAAAFRVLNHLGWSVEIVCGVLFLVPQVGVYAGALFAGSFLMIAATIRLTFLAEMVAVGTVLFVYPHTGFDDWLVGVIRVSDAAPSGSTIGDVLAWALVACLVVYLALLPLAYAGMSVNFYARKRLVGPLQRWLDWWIRLTGLILWRVFTSDVINFYADIGIRSQASDPPTPYLTMRPWDARTEWRYMHVGEFICLASIFTTLKYYPKDRALFEARILRYCRSLPVPSGGEVVFDYRTIVKGATGFEFPIVARFVVNTATGKVEEHTLDPSFDLRAPARASPVYAGTRPGSYAPS